MLNVAYKWTTPRLHDLSVTTTKLLKTQTLSLWLSDFINKKGGTFLLKFWVRISVQENAHKHKEVVKVK